MSPSRALACVNVAAIERNCARLRSELHEDVRLCAVVKADGYGHGAIHSAQGALAGGARWLAVASVQEASELIDLVAEERARLLVLGPLLPIDVEESVFLGVDVVAWHEQFVEDLSAIAQDMDKTARVHVKLDSGMGRLGVGDPECATRLAAAAAAAPHVELAGIMTHFATADEPRDTFFAKQLERFTSWAQAVKREHPEVVVHAANSAAMLRDPAAHFDMVRCGIAVYGMDPFGEDPRTRGLEPALALSSYVAAVKLCRAGESTGYGRRFVADADTYIGLLPIGYGDGWRRGLSNNADVLIGGHRRPLVGTVSMDSITVDLGSDPAALALRDQPAVLIGAQGAERITAEEVARRLDTINYEIACGLTARVARVYEDDGEVFAVAGGE
jgi:alanine racemase